MLWFMKNIDAKISRKAKGKIEILEISFVDYKLFNQVIGLGKKKSQK